MEPKSVFLHKLQAFGGNKESLSKPGIYLFQTNRRILPPAGSGFI
jgi:hypothetical protein